MSDHQEPNESFGYEEQVLVESYGGVTALRLEASSRWNPNTKFHPFGHLNKLFEVADKIIGVADDLNSPGQDDEDHQPFLEMIMQISSRATQDLPSSNKKRLGLVATMDGSLPTGPSGFIIQIRSSLPPSPSLTTKIEAMVQSWMNERLITTPILNASWDVVAERGGGKNNSDSQKPPTTLVQVFLPTNGAAWSADALQQSFRASLGCEQQSQFMGISATTWSNQLVTGAAWNKQLWWKVSSKEKTRRVTVGLQLEQETKNAESLLSLMESSKTSCLLGNRSIQHVHPASSSISPLQSYKLGASKALESSASEPPTTTIDPLASVDMVLRRTYPQKGRLETWITASSNNIASSECSLQFRQVIPPYLTPSWQTLEVLTSKEDTPKIQPYVEWIENGASVVTFSLASISESSLTVMSLEYGPKFVPYDDIPGDPNRGRELPPAVVHIQCPLKSFDLYSNSPLMLPPVPDMSMPFNVLSLSCSLYAYLIGTIISLLVKRASEKVTYKLHPEKKPKSKLEKLKEKIKSKLNKLKGEKNHQETDSKEDGDRDTNGNNESNENKQNESLLPENKTNKGTD